MSRDPLAASARRPARPTRRPGWVPQQHGAWAMLLVPFLAGVLRSHGSWLQMPLLGFWLVAYLAFQATGLWVRSRFKRRYRAPVLAYGVGTLALGVPIAVLRPDLLWWAPAFAVCLAVSLWFSWRRRDRALVNDVVTILAAGLFGLVTYQAGYSPGGTILAGWRGMVVIVAVLIAYFVGTALYVKTMIRERGSRGYRIASVAYHAAVTLVLALAVAVPTLPPGMPHRPMTAFAACFAVLTVRAWALAGRAVRPLYVGLGELGVCAVLLAIIAVWR